MGYESKIFVVDRNECTFPNGKGCATGLEVARFELSVMGNEEVGGKTFRDIFATPIDFDICGLDGNRLDNPRVDGYGETCGWATIGEVTEWLENSNVGKEYRRAELLLDCLRAIKKYEGRFDQLCVVHYGH